MSGLPHNVGVSGRSFPWVQGATLTVATGSSLVAIVLSALSWAPFVDYFPAWLNVASAAALVLATAHLVQRKARRRAQMTDLVPLVVLPFIINTALALAPKELPPPAEQPWTMSWTVLSVCISPLIMARRFSIPWATCVLASSVLLRAPLNGWGISIVEAVISAWGGLAAYWAVRSAARLYERADMARHQANSAAEAADAEVHREQALTWWDQLLHDKIIGALMLGARSTTPEQLKRAQTLATEALDRLSELESMDSLADRSVDAVEAGSHELNATDLRTGLTALAEAVGLEMKLHGRGSQAPVEVVVALLASTEQAFTNVLRHSGTRSVRVDYTQSLNAASVTIRDRGVGFDLESVDPRRAGLVRSIPGHLAQLGGSVDIRSAPGLGTTVTLTWSAMNRGGFVSVHEWSHLWWITAIWVLAHAGGGWIQEGRLAWSPAGLSAVALLALAAGLVHLPRPRWSMNVGPAVVLAAASILAWTTPPADGQSWRLWFVGALDPLVAFPAARGRPRQALLLGVGAALVIVTGYGRHSPEHARFAIQAVAQLVLFPILTWIMAESVSRANGRLAAAHRRVADATQRTSRSRARQVLVRERVTHMDPVVLLLLNQLSAGRAFGADDRRLAHLAEAASRDQLVARALLCPDVVASVAAARARGVTVHLSASAEVRPASKTEGDALRDLQAALIGALNHARDGDRVTARWRPESLHACGTLTVSRPDELGDDERDDAFLEFGNVSGMPTRLAAEVGA